MIEQTHRKLFAVTPALAALVLVGGWAVPAAAQQTEQTTGEQTHDGVTVRLQGARYHAGLKTLLVRVEYWGEELHTVKFGRPVVRLDGVRHDPARGCGCVVDWPVLAGKGRRVQTWNLRHIAALPESVDIEIPLRRTYDGPESVLWDDVDVTTERRSPGTTRTDVHRLTVHELWWQPAGTTATTSTGASGLRHASVCVVWSAEQTRETADPVVDRRLQLWTTDGEPLEYGGGSGAGERLFHQFRSERPTTVRLTWTPTFARDTGEMFAFSGIAPERLAAPRTITTPHGTVTITGAVEGALDAALEDALKQLRERAQPSPDGD